MSPLTELIGGAKVYGWGNLLQATAFESIASATGTGSSGVITFSSIPSTYQHLQLRWIARDTNATSGGIDLLVRINGDTGSNYAEHFLRGDGSAAAASGLSSRSFFLLDGGSVGNGASSGIVAAGILDLHDYASTTKNKTVRSFQGNDRNGDGAIYLKSALWMSTSAVTQISISAFSNFGTTTQFALYGIKGA
jgi:hypothetical protein